jgi:hypothetical protein
MQMRRLFLALLPALLVVIAQQAALVHEIGHGFGFASDGVAAAAQGSQDPGTGTTDRGSTCEKCFQFAHVAHAVSAIAPAFVLLASCLGGVPGHPVPEIAIDAPASRCRGPPSYL